VTLVGADCNLPSSGKYIAGPGEVFEAFVSFEFLTIIFKQVLYYFYKPCRRGFSRRGRSGEDLLIPVPLGTIIRDGGFSLFTC
jgi:hypothetical protein